MGQGDHVPKSGILYGNENVISGHYKTHSVSSQYHQDTIGVVWHWWKFPRGVPVMGLWRVQEEVEICCPKIGRSYYGESKPILWTAVGR
jgi:hypothetical protein